MMSGSRCLATIDRLASVTAGSMMAMDRIIGAAGEADLAFVELVAIRALG